jgi:hypothetical protein
MRKFVWKATTIFTQSFFGHEQQEESKERELGARVSMEGELWSVLECIWS